MPRRATYNQFKGDKNQKYFLDLCSKSVALTVKWSKFLAMDAKKKKLFQGLSLPILHMQFRKITYSSQGICWQCAERPVYRADYCKECYEKIKTKSLANQKKRYEDAKRNRSQGVLEE
jgi:hypothetical protein